MNGRAHVKQIAAIATGVLIVTSPTEAAPSSQPVERFTTPPINGVPAPFSKAVRVRDVLYLSGVIGRTVDGKVPEGIEAQTHAAMDDIGTTLKRAGLGYGDLFHCTVFLSDMSQWAAFNKVYVAYFPAGQLPARSAVGVTALALPGALMEIECQAYAGRSERPA
jgi:2-iminobutanoate/2-iminopropanoate deaminase